MDLEAQITELFDTARDQTLAVVREMYSRLAGLVGVAGGEMPAVPAEAKGRTAAKAGKKPAIVGSKVRATLKARNKCPVCGKRGKGPRFGFHCDDHKAQFLSRKAASAASAAAGAAEGQAAGAPPAEGEAGGALPTGSPKLKGKGKETAKRRGKAKK